MATGRPSALLVEFEFSPGVWTDLTDDVALGDAPVEIQVGRTDANSDAQPGTCTFLLDNSTGDYMPDNPLSAYYGELIEGIQVRVRVTASATTSTRFVGRIPAGGIEPDYPSTPSLSRTRITAIDLLGDLQGIQLRSALAEQIIADGAVNYFPLDEGDGATVALSPLASPPIVSLSAGLGTGVVFGKKAGAHKGVTAASGAALSGSAESTGAGDNVISVWFSMPSTVANAPLATVLYGEDGGSLSLFTLGGKLHVLRVAGDGAVVFDGLSDYSGAVNDGSLWRVVYADVWDFGSSKMQATVFLDNVAGSLGMVTSALYGSSDLALYTSKLTLGTGTDLIISNVATMHAATPILVATSWMSTQWETSAGALATPTRTLSDQLASLTAWTGITCAFSTTSTKLGTTPDTAGKSALEVLLAIARGETGIVYVDYSTGNVVALANADAYPTTPTTVIDSAADGIEGPQLARAANRFATVTASSPVASVTVTDSTVAGGSSTTVESTLARRTDLEALASKMISQGRDAKARLRKFTADLVTATNALYTSLFNLRPGKRIRYGNLPSTYFGVTWIDGYAEGWIERIDLERYELVPDLSPADAPRFGVWDTSRWAFGDGVCTVTGGTAVGGTGTGTIILTWAAAVALSTAAGDYPMDFDWNGERVTVTAAPAGGTSPRTLTITARGVAPTVARVHAAGEPIDVWDAGHWAP